MVDNFFTQKIWLPVFLLYGLRKTIVTSHTDHAAHFLKILCAVSGEITRPVNAIHTLLRFQAQRFARTLKDAGIEGFF